MDAIKFLLEEHNTIRKIFEKIQEESREETKKQMFDFFCKDLVRHEKMEQEIWYPALKPYTTFAKEIKHLLQEEDAADKAIKELKEIKDEKQWGKKFMMLKKDVSQHAEEEETKLFPDVKATLENEELKTLGEKLHTFKSKHTNYYL